MLNQTSKKSSLTNRLLAGLFFGLGVSLSIGTVSFLVYLVLAVAPGTTNPVGPPPGNDVSWAPLYVDPTNNRVGIVNPTPNFTLDVSGQIHATQDICTDASGGKCLSTVGGSLWTQSGTNIYYNMGNVGIGTTGPGANLHVNDRGMGDDTQPKLKVGGGIVSNATMNIIDNDSGNALQIWDDNDLVTPRFIVQRIGNVGIGTASPGARFHVYDSANGRSVAWFKDVPVNGEISLAVLKNVGGTYVFEQVTMAGLDSCGAGYRCLRVQN